MVIDYLIPPPIDQSGEAVNNLGSHLNVWSDPIHNES